MLLLLLVVAVETLSGADSRAGGSFGNGMEMSRGTVLSSGIPLLLSSLWIVPYMWGGGCVGRNVLKFSKQIKKKQKTLLPPHYSSVTNSCTTGVSCGGRFHCQTVESPNIPRH